MEAMSAAPGGKTVNAIAIQLGHSLVLLVVMAGIIGAWPA